MKRGLIYTLIICVFANQMIAQKNCSTVNYQQQELSKDPSLKQKMNAIEAFTRQAISSNNNRLSRGSGMGPDIIKIPVVVHILYHQSYENISDEQVLSQIAALNMDYRRQNPDTVNTPEVFKPLAADCKIEFQLAVSDSRRRSTTGIIRKYTPITTWEADDKMKFNAEMGDDAWDSKSYLNIWVCNLDRVAGYSSLPGGPEDKDGVVIGFPAFGTMNNRKGYDMGKTAVHEVGHWLNLKHIWGDSDCGDDLVDDTPKQSIYTVGCPSVIRISCGNGPNGNMYMNYMDFTEDACMNMFTWGQKARMMAMFAEGGPRYSILSSTGLSAPLVFDAPIPDDAPTWLKARLYPNPATTEMILDLAYDVRWIGKKITINNLQGQIVMQLTITSKIQRIDISRLNSGMYFLFLKKEDGSVVKQKFVKL